MKPDDVPKSIDDLLQPKWKGKMLMDSNGPEWYVAMAQILEFGLAVNNYYHLVQSAKERGRPLNPLRPTLSLAEFTQ